MEVVMEHVKDWKVTLHLFEEGKQTVVRAVLTTGDTEVRAHGEAHLSPYDRNIPEIGDELAVGRALINLGTKLLRATESDIEAIEGEPVHLDH